MKNKILLLGSMGLVGTSFEYCLNYRDVEYLALSHSDFDLAYPYPELSKTFAFFEPNIVINCVGVVGVNPCCFNPVRAKDVNIRGVEILIELCNKYNSILVQISTHSVFDGTKDKYYIETDVPNPINMYGRTKYEAEKIVENYDKYYIFRFPTLFGIRRKGRVGFPTKLIDDLRDGKSIVVSEEKVDSPSYSMDVAAMALHIIRERLPFGVYHIANQGDVNYFTFFNEVLSNLPFSNLISVKPEKEFNSPEPNPIFTPLDSVKIGHLRPWYEALGDFLYGYIL